jgi:5-methylcytosine-specific restriction enzyme subunit McrC
MGGASLRWPSTDPTPGMIAILPRMKTDIVVDDLRLGTRVVIDTKYADILSKGRYRPILKSDYIYQIYAYLRSQEERDVRARHAEGLLIHPTVDKEFDESVIIQGHRLRFATVDLMAPTMSIRRRLRSLVDDRARAESEELFVRGPVS